MIKKYFVLILFFSFQHLHSADRSEILLAMDKYNEAFILADYDQIIENFTFPVSIITSERMLSIDTKFESLSTKKLEETYQIYSYSKWNNIDIHLWTKTL